jgi:hypothetical protein
VNTADLADLKKALLKVSANDAVEVITEVFGELLMQLGVRVMQLETDLDARSHKGVWDANYTYRKHNTVTHAGCQWTAISNDDLGQPGKTAGWLLTVKKGRDGKDAPP